MAGIEKFFRYKDCVLKNEIPGWLARHKRKSYIIAVAVSAPPWMKPGNEHYEALLCMRKEAQRLSKETGIMHVLAHRVPLTHPKVCGLTVPWNLTIKTWRENLSEGNRWSDEECVQLTLELET